MIELTEADRAAIANAIAGTYARFETRKHDWGCCKDAAEDAIYRAGLAAGIERAAKRVENGRFLHDDAYQMARFARESAAAIRALVK